MNKRLSQFFRARGLIASIGIPLVSIPTTAIAAIGEFDATSGQTFGGYPVSQVDLVDIDNDQDLDAVILKQTSGIQIFLNDGTGNYSAQVQNLVHPNATRASASGAAFEDFDGDGDLDLFVSFRATNATGKEGVLWRNNGSGFFVLDPQLMGVGDSLYLEKGDFNGDGHIDTLVSNRGTGGSAPDQENYMWFNDGTGQFTGVVFPRTDYGSDFHYEAADIDADGDLDIIASPSYAGSNLRTYEVYLNDGAANFSLNSTFSAPGGWASAGDIDGDGDLDLVLGIINFGGTTPVWLNDGVGNFSQHATSLDTSGGYTWSSWGTMLFDADNDGDLDAMNSVGSENALWLNDGTGVFSNSGQTFSPTPRQASAGDVDGDGDLDILTNFNNSNKIWFNAGEPPADTDADGILDGEDNCPLIANPMQFDLDQDGMGDLCDNDDDNDGTEDSVDLCPLIFGRNNDADNDGLANECDADADGDGFKWDPGYEASFDLGASIPAGDGWQVERVTDAILYYRDADNFRIPGGLVLDDAQGLKHAMFTGGRGIARNRLNFYYAKQDAAGQWTEEVITTISREELGSHIFAGGGNSSTFAVDASTGNVYAILTYQSGFDDLLGRANTKSVFAVKSGGQWSITALPEMDDARYGNTTLAIDSTGLIHVVYEVNHRGYYATYDGASWTTNSFSNGVYFLDMAMGSDDKAHVSFAISGGGTGLNYMVLDPQNPSPAAQIIFNQSSAPHSDPAFEFAGYYADIELNPSNEPVVIYTNSNGDTAYSQLANGSWSHTALGIRADQFAFAVDASNKFHLAYNVSFAGANFDSKLDYMVVDGASTQSETLYYRAAVGGELALELDSQNNPQVLFTKRYPSTFGAGWAATIDRPFYENWDFDWEGVLLASPQLTSPVAVEEQRYVMVTDAGTDPDIFSKQYYLSFDEGGLAHSKYPEDLDIRVGILTCVGSSCTPTEGPQQAGDYRGASVQNDIETSGSATAIADFNNDGLSDYIAVGKDANGAVIVEFQEKVSAEKNAFASRVLHQNYPLHTTFVDTLSGSLSDYVDATAADFNGDANIDLVITDQSLPGVRVYLGNGDGSFQSAIELSMTATPAGVDAEDVNNDGNADFVVASVDGKVEVFVGNGDATFGQSTISLVATGATTAGVALSDFDRDQKVDMVVTNMTDGIAFYKGNGDGTFASTAVLSQVAELGAPSTLFRSIDNNFFNQDIHMDLIMTNPETKASYVFVWEGDGVFSLLDQQFANYIDWENNFCDASQMDLIAGEKLTCLQDPTRVEFLPWLEWGDATPAGISAFPYYDLISPVDPIAPIAAAGDDQVAQIGDLITLDGAASSDPDENYPLSYSWTLIDAPASSAATLADSDTVAPTFTADALGDFVLRLEVTDSMGLVSAVDTIVISTFNTAPVADAGVDQSISVLGDMVYLDGSQSVDPDGDDISYQWSFTQKPAGSQASLSDTTVMDPTFIADINGEYVLSLTVSDDWAFSEEDSVTINFENIAPVSIPGVNQSVVAGDAVALDGSASSDANGDSLTYDWAFVSKPVGSLAALDDSSLVNPGFTADLDGEYIISLVVNDGLVDSAASNVTVVAVSLESVFSQKMTELMDIVNSLDDSVFKKKAAKKRYKFTRRLSRVLKRVDRQKYVKAINTLEKRIISKVDGCALEGAPQKRDWITDCAVQQDLYDRANEILGLINQMSN